jgi:hypothetical protein
MSPEDVLRQYGRSLSQYERDEVQTFDKIYYINPHSKYKGVG